MQIDFPVEFIVRGTPVSQQAKLQRSLEEWKEQVRKACRPVLPQPHFASELPVSVKLYYLPPDEMKGDLDNIIKPILDALKQFVIVDDNQVERILVQKFEPERRPALVTTSTILQDAWAETGPVVYIRVSDNFAEEPI